jgi:hypothetical protein
MSQNFKIKTTIKNMKHILVCIGLMIGMSFQTHEQPPKKYSVTLPLEDWSNKLNGIEYTKQRLRQSDLPSKETTFIIDSVLTPIQVSISSQVNAVLAAEKKVIDSTNNKKK